MAGDGAGFAEELLGLDGFRVPGVADLEGEVLVLVETTAAESIARAVVWWRRRRT